MDKAADELEYFMDLEPWAEKEIQIQAWILRLALESLD